jgi:hypothetical protein
MSTFPKFKGNCPRNVAKDAKYTVKSGKGKPVIALTYNTGDDERWYITTEDHIDLVNMVNNVKLEVSGKPFGSFYINEYKQVLVPAVGSDSYFLAGEYENPLRFEFEGKVISGEPIDLGGQPISPGDLWVGPHAGIPYTLSAGGKDIKFTTVPRPNVEKTVKLSKIIGFEKAESVASKIQAFKGFAGGRFYVNEFCSIFAPIQEGYEWNYLYLGQLDLDTWFEPVQKDLLSDYYEKAE